MSDLVDRARAALEGVTRGPWKWTDSRVRELGGRGGEPGGYEYDCTVLEADHRGECGCRSACELNLWVNDKDAEFIAAARQLVPELAARLAALEQAVARVRERAEDTVENYIDDGELVVAENILRALDGTEAIGLLEAGKAIANQGWEPKGDDEA